MGGPISEKRFNEDQSEEVNKMKEINLVMSTKQKKKHREKQMRWVWLEQNEWVIAVGNVVKEWHWAKSARAL